MIKVSVVVPTYATSAAGLSRLINSLDRQTMSTDEFEVIFVDDGSPDDTFFRLNEIARTRRHVRVTQIENSGWPSKPRNIGTDLASGEFIAYMDHDDELYPDALRAAHAFATANRSDVVNAKEVRTKAPVWAMDAYAADIPQAIGLEHRHPLLPMNPHKLYRRKFLKEHGIRFPEGRKVMWEDIFFNLQVARHATVMSTLSSTPYYHWVVNPGSGSTTFLKWADDYWALLRRVLTATNESLAEATHDLQRRQVLIHQYSHRVLGAFDGKYLKRPVEARSFLFEHARELQSEFALSELDPELPSHQRVRAAVLASGNQQLMEEICTDDPPIPGWATACSAVWRGGVLHVTAHVEWSNKDGRRHKLERVDERILKRYSPAANASLSVSARDVTAEIEGADVLLVVRDRKTQAPWPTTTEHEMRVSDHSDGSVTISAECSATVDPAHCAFGAPLDPGRWDLFVRATTTNPGGSRALASSAPATLTITNDALHLVYPNDGGSATLFTHGQQEAVRRLAPTGVRLLDTGELEVTLCGIHDGTGSVATQVALAPSSDVHRRLTLHPATISVSDGSALLRFAPPSPRFRARIGDRTGDRNEYWEISIDGTRVRYRQPGSSLADSPPCEPELLRERKTAKSAPDGGHAGRALRKLRRYAGRVLRRLGLR